MISVDDMPAAGRRLLAAFCLATAVAAAFPSRADTDTAHIDETGLAHIRADNMKYDMKTGISSYTGNVQFSYKGIELSGDSVRIKQTDDAIEQLDVSGSPARYRQTVDNGETIKAESLKMTYSSKSNQLILTDSARLEQAGHIVESQRIIYDSAQEVVLAGQINPQDRVNITLTPKKELPEQAVPAPAAGTDGNK